MSLSQTHIHSVPLVFVYPVVGHSEFIDAFYLQIEAMYSKAHAAIRANPDHQSKQKKGGVQKKRWTAKKLTHAQRKAKVDATKKEVLEQIEAQRD